MPPTPRSTTSSADRQVSPRREGGRPQVRDFVVALVVLSVYHVLVAERYRTPNFFLDVAHVPSPPNYAPRLNHRHGTKTWNAKRKHQNPPSSYTSANTMKARRIPHPKGPPPKLLQNHSIMKRAGSWAPIVLEEYKVSYFSCRMISSIVYPLSPRSWAVLGTGLGLLVFGPLCVRTTVILDFPESSSRCLGTP